MAIDLELYSFAVDHSYFDPAAWEDANGTAALRSIEAVAAARCDLDRRHEWLNWVLKRLEVGPPTTGVRPNDMAVVYGSERIAPNAVSWVGLPIRWNSSALCQQMKDHLDAIERQQLISAIDIGAMDAASLYKFDGGFDRGELEEVIVDMCARLRTFYTEAARLGHASLHHLW